MDESYAALAAYLNVGEDEVVLGPSTSQNVYVLSHAFRSKWNQGDEIVVTNQDHEANSGPWRRLENQGIIVKEWQIDPQTGLLSLDSLDQLLSERTRLIAFPHCSNIVAHINPVASICERARSVGAKTVVDGVSYAGHGFPDVDALGADVYLFSTYKTFGPHLGLMVVRSDTLSYLENQSHYFNANALRSKLVPAGPDHAQIAAAGGIAEYFDAIYEHHRDDVNPPTSKRAFVQQIFREHEQNLLGELLAYLETRSDLHVLGPADPVTRAPTVSLRTTRDAHMMVEELTARKVMCWNGDFYSPRLIEALSIDAKQGVLRLSFVHYTSREDIRQLIDALETVPA